MKAKNDEIQALSIPVAENFSGKIQTLEARAGSLKKLHVKWETSKAAGNALASIELARIKGEEDLARTGINLAVATLKTAMVANTMPRIGMLTSRLNANTAAVDQALTNGGLAECATHMHNRSENIGLFRELKGGGKINDQEAEALISFAEADAIQDIERTRKRTGDAHNAVDALHTCGLKWISNSQDVVKRNS